MYTYNAIIVDSSMAINPEILTCNAQKKHHSQTVSNCFDNFLIFLQNNV